MMPKQIKVKGKEKQLQTALVTGANNGIGLALIDLLIADQTIGNIYACCRDPSSSKELMHRASQQKQLNLVELDVTDASSIKKAKELVQASKKLDLLINTAGILHKMPDMRPEKRLRDINAANMLLAYDVNALGTLRLAMEFELLLKASESSKFICLSARVGSISDNNTGGWYAYRASKAALNMLLKTIAIEWSRTNKRICCAALHPGTVATDLSAPFTNSGYKGNLFHASEAAKNILNVISTLSPDDSGGFFSWDGKKILW
jgi:NAD(P)-dependent dehydrogenase (short-subunit alcohol dehydrogenase family)